MHRFECFKKILLRLNLLGLKILIFFYMKYRILLLNNTINEYFKIINCFFSIHYQFVENKFIKYLFLIYKIIKFNLNEHRHHWFCFIYLCKINANGIYLYILNNLNNRYMKWFFLCRKLIDFHGWIFKLNYLNKKKLFWNYPNLSYFFFF